jgi:flagellin-like protein
MANKFAKNDEAVSAVIGVILMVAITVILAAVIAAFVFGMGQNVKKTYTVAVTATRQSSDTIALTNMGGNDVAKLKPLAGTDNPFLITVNGHVATTDALYAAGLTDPAAGLSQVVGSSITIKGTDIVATSGSGVHVVVTGVFSDNTNQVLLDTYV